MVVKLTGRGPVFYVTGAVDDGVVVCVARRTQTVALLQPVQVSSGHAVRRQVAHLHAADETPPRAHA